MKKLICFLFISILFYSNETKAQSSSPEIIWGDNIKQKGPNSFTILEYFDNQQYWTIEYAQKNYLYKYSSENHEEIASILLKINDERTGVLLLEKQSDLLSGFFSQYDKKSNEFKIVTGKIKDKEIVDTKEVFKHPYKIPARENWYGYQINGTLAQSMTPSKDASHFFYTNLLSQESTLLFGGLGKSKKDKKIPKQVFAMFDKNMDLVWEQTIELPDPFETMVTSKGEVIFLCKKSILKNGKFDKFSDNEIILIKMNKNGIVEYPINLEHDNNTMSTNLKLAEINENNEAVLLGLYRTNFDKNRTFNGTFFAKLNLDTKEFTYKFKDFSQSFIDKVAGRSSKRKGKEKSKGKGISKDFKLPNSNDVIKFDDGSYSFIAIDKPIENSIRLNEDPNNSRNNSFESNTQFYENEIIVPKFDAEGNLITIGIINKRLVSGFFLNSIYLFKYNNKLHLIYNREKKYKGSTYPSKTTELAIVNENGKVKTKKVLFTSKDVGGIFNSTSTRQHDDKLLIRVSKKKKSKRGLFELKALKTLD